VGKTGRVSERIDRAANTGRVIVEGDDWRAVSENDVPIESGARVEIIRVDSTILLVRPHHT
jgi:membrane protein implicated in regulation of membrane protease activity